MNRWSALGLALMIGSEVLTLAKVEPFWSWNTPICWTGFIVFADAVVFRATGASWIRTKPREFVWLALASIPYGQTVSYGEQARRLGLGHDAARAVGAANGRNPLPVVLPCHRVIGADGSLTGFGGGLDVKRFLLEHEGALLRLG